MALDSLRFAHRFDQISGSAIREIFKMIAKPGMISFAGGNPAASALPDAECAEIDTVLEKTRASIEEYKKLKQAVIMNRSLSSRQMKKQK